VEIVRKRMPVWISALFVAGFAFSALGLFTSIAAYREYGSITAGLVAFAVFLLLFGWAVLQLLLPLRPRPRIVPYFATELGPYGGDTMRAFRRGRALYLEIAALDALRTLGYQPAATVYIQSVTEEECTGNGALSALQRGYRADAALIPEPEDDKLVRANTGVIWFQVKVRGVPVHVREAGAGANAIEAAIRSVETGKAQNVPVD